ncbi:hypothetical protein L0F63_006894, partial [Massospora cicadina]
MSSDESGDESDDFQTSHVNLGAELFADDLMEPELAPAEIASPTKKASAVTVSLERWAQESSQSSIKPECSKVMKQVTFVDKKGKIVLKRVQCEASPVTTTKEFTEAAPKKQKLQSNSQEENTLADAPPK